MKRIFTLVLLAAFMLPGAIFAAEENVKEEGNLDAKVRRLVQEEIARRDAEKAKAEKEAAEKAEKAEKAEEDKTVAVAKKEELNRGLIESQFKKSHITFLMGDDNLRDNTYYSPKFKIGANEDLYDYNKRFLGYDNRSKGATTLTLFHENEGIIPNLTTRIGISFSLYHKLDPASDKVKTAIQESGSYLEIDYTTDFTARLTLFPYNSDRMSVGFFPGLRWGSREVFPQSTGEPVPGFQALYAKGPFSVYAGMKTHAQSKTDKAGADTMTEMETVYGVFGGATYQDNGLKVSLQGGFVDKGDNVNIKEEDLSDSDDDEIYSYGVDLFAQYEDGAYIGEPLGVNRYRNGDWRDPSYEGDIAFRLRGEGIFLNERLQNADYLASEKDKSTEITDDFFAYAGALEASFRVSDFRFFALTSYRSLSFLVFDAPGIMPFMTIPSGSDTGDELMGSITADYNYKFLWFGVTAGMKKPAYFKAPGDNHVTVVRDRISSNSLSTAEIRTPLPEGEEALNIAFYRFNIRSKFSESLAANLELGFTQDHNRTKTPYKSAGSEDSTELEWDRIETRDIFSLFLSVEGRF